MKSILICFLAFVLFSPTSFSQFSIPIQEGEMNMSQGKNNALYMNLTKVSQKELNKAWTKYIKDFKGGKTKKNKKAKEIFSDNMLLKNISNNTIDVYAKSIPNNDAIQFVVWFDMGGAFLNSQMHTEVYPEAEKMLQDFALTISKAMIEDMLAAEKKKLGKLEGDLKGLGKDKKGYENDIEKFEKKIVEAKEKIVQNGKDQVTKEEEINAQKKIVESIIEKLSELK